MPARKQCKIEKFIGKKNIIFFPCKKKQCKIENILYEKKNCNIFSVYNNRKRHNLPSRTFHDFLLKRKRQLYNCVRLYKSCGKIFHRIAIDIYNMLRRDLRCRRKESEVKSQLIGQFPNLLRQPRLRSFVRCTVPN